MKKKWYRSGWMKGIAILLSYVMLVCAAFGGIVIYRMGRAGISLESGEDFRDSSKFSELVYDNGYRIIFDLKSEIVKEILGENTDSALMDVDIFYQGEAVSLTKAVNPSREESSGFLYKAADLNKWAEEWGNTDYYGYDMPLLRCRKEDGTYHYYYYKEFIQGLKNGTIECELSQTAEEEYFSYEETGGFLQNCTDSQIAGFLSYAAYDGREFGEVTDKSASIPQNYVGCMAVGDYNPNLIDQTTGIGEPYSPDGYENILDFVNQNPEWKPEDAFTELAYALNELNGFINGTYGYGDLSTYEERKTNVTYLYADLEQEKIYTNKKDYENYNNLDRALGEMQGYSFLSYVLISSEEGGSTNIDKMTENNLLGALEYHADYISDAQNYVFALGIDTGFPADDKLAAANEEYNRFAGKLKPVLAAEAISAVLWLMLILWLTLMAGRKPEDEEIHLNWFDGIYTEIAAVLTGGVLFFGLMLGLNLNMPIDHVKELTILGIAFAIFAQTLFLVGWLSLVRRIKAKTIWENSLCRLVCKWIYKGCKRIIKWFKKIINGFQAMIYGRDILLDGLKRISGGELQYKIPLEKVNGKRREMAKYINNIGDGLDAAVEKTMRSERMKTDLITNVSHDIKTPLTSIINYVDLLKRENFTDPKIQGYLQILDEKSQRLKILTEDVVEASKASSGNINLEMTELDFVELIHQVLGEFEEKFQEKNLTMMVHFEDEASVIRADGQRMWRVLSNIFGNVVKYAMEGTRVYAEVCNKNKKVIFTLKNISAQPLNISADELTERFIRGDISRNTEGSGLGLSIAKSLTELQGGEFKLFVDGDLFKVMITFAAEGKKEK